MLQTKHSSGYAELPRSRHGDDTAIAELLLRQMDLAIPGTRTRIVRNRVMECMERDQPGDREDSRNKG